MSHFTVLVTGDDYKAALAPFHEFECTGIDDEFVQEIEDTEEMRADYETNGDPELDKSFAHFINRWTNRPILTKPRSADQEEGRYGYVLVEDGVVRSFNRTNPNGKWDWYEVGGRWRGSLLLKKGAEGVIGEPSSAALGGDFTGRVDQARIKDIDLREMLREERERASEEYNAAAEVIAGRDWRAWGDFLKEVDAGTMTLDEAREAHNAQPVARDFASSDRWFLSGWSNRFHGVSRGDFVAQAKSFTPFAILHEGKWHERGSMGWWAMVSDENPRWSDVAEEIINSLDPETVVTVVDCHI